MKITDEMVAAAARSMNPDLFSGVHVIEHRAASPIQVYIAKEETLGIARLALEAAVADVPVPKAVKVDAERATEKLKLWFFRDLLDEHRTMLFGLFGMPVSEIRNHGDQNHAFRHVVAALAAPAPEAVKAKDQLIRKSGQVAIDELIDRMDGKHPGNHDLADYLGRIVDACVRAALNAEGK